MNINGIAITDSQRQLLRLATHRELQHWQDSVGRAYTDIAAEYCREQVRQCRSLLNIVTEQTVCDASAGQ